MLQEPDNPKKPITSPYNGPNIVLAPIIALFIPGITIILGLLAGFYVVYLKKKGKPF